MRVLSTFLLLALGAIGYAHAAATPTAGAVAISGSSLTVDGKAFKVHGVAYSPVPMGETPSNMPHGDYYTADYSYIWARDLPLLKSSGFNTIRIYSWDNLVDHTLFLDACHQHGVKVILTHYVGTEKDTPIGTEADRTKVTNDFVDHVKHVGDHPALLMWSFGNEMNGPWNGFLDVWNTEGDCDWSASCTNVVNKTQPCFQAATCVYEGFFPWLNSILAAGKQHTTRPMTSTFADLDVLIADDKSVDKIPRFEKLIPALDAWAIQLYRGQDLKGFIYQYGLETEKPLLVGEYGVDSLNDPCGWPENRDVMRPCFLYSPGFNGQPGGSVDTGASFVGCTGPNSYPGCQNPGEVTQSEYDTALTRQFIESDIVLGGILMAWHDELWKNVGVQDRCEEPCPKGKDEECLDPSSELHKALKSSSAKCSAHAHVDCEQHDLLKHSACGYYLQSAPDAYVNEAWFGLHSTEDCGLSDPQGGHRLTALTPRKVMKDLAVIYDGPQDKSTRTCDQMKPCWTCSTTRSAQDIAKGTCDAVCGTNFATLFNNSDDTTPGPGIGTDVPADSGKDAGDINAAATGTSSMAFVGLFLTAVAALFVRV